MTDEERLDNLSLRVKNMYEPMLYVPYSDMTFLIEQAERAEELKRVLHN